MIYVEDELIKLNGVVLPGLVKSIEVIETAKVDEQEVEGSATKPKQATGYEDAKVNIELIIDDTPSQTKYQRYATLRAIFRSPGQSVPQPIPIISEDTAAHGVEKVIFKKLSHKGENKRGQLTATLELWEYIPQTITAKSGSSSGSSSGSGKSGGGVGHQLYTQLMNGVSHMLPFVVGGGILIAIAFLIDGLLVDMNALDVAEKSLQILERLEIFLIQMVHSLQLS